MSNYNSLNRLINEYFIKYDKDHTYNLYIVNRYDYKDFIKIKSDN